jgi:hypothetical protein
MTEPDREIQTSRQAVYGPWRENMRGTSEQIEGLRVQWEANNPGKPLPSWWFPLVMVIAKLNRAASGVYHADNFTDARVYLEFVERMQKAEAPGGAT